MLKSRKNGFTIVELLIVIVVIGILAAISVVAYSGVQERAKSSAVISLARGYIDSLQLWATDNSGTYPVPTGDIGTCLGRASQYVGAVCPDAPGWGGPANYDAVFNQNLSKYRSNNGGDIGYWGGSPVGVLWYHANYYGEGHAVIWYAVGPNNDCGLPNIQNPSPSRALAGAKFTSRTSLITSCIVQLN